MPLIWKRRQSEKMPTSRRSSSPIMKPLSALAVPGMYLFYKFNEYKRQQHEHQKRKVTEKELDHLNNKIDRLLAKIDEHEVQTVIQEEPAEEECVICLGAKATMQTYPCGHKVVCRKCFIKTIQVAVSQRCLPLRCVVCRTRIMKLRQFSTPKSKTSSQNTLCQKLFSRSPRHQPLCNK